MRRQALHPFRELPVPKNVTQFPLDGAVMTINPFPGPQVCWPASLDFDVAAAVEETRRIAREHDKDTVAWWIAPEHDPLVPSLEALGIANKDTPGFEATENAMALVHEPRGGRPEGVEVRLVETFGDYVAVARVIEANFGYPPQNEDALHARYDEYVNDENGESVVAVIDGKIVGSAFGAFGGAGINLFGGSVLEEARGRGIYRAMTFARWDMAVERGTPALTVQAGKMSMPICEHLGFELVDRARIFVDELAS